jgi:hypothetical protein
LPVFHVAHVRQPLVANQPPRLQVVLISICGSRNDSHELEARRNVTEPAGAAGKSILPTLNA